MSEAAEGLRPPLRALLVEDSRLDAELVRVQLERTWPGLQLEVLREEAAFVEALRTREWDVVLSDFELPGFTGADLLAQRNELAPDIPFVFVSGVIGEDNAVELLKKGATDYVSKSRLARLAPVLERALREAEERHSACTAAVATFDALLACFRQVLDAAATAEEA
jgi:DNA-binding NtrC family response regulator